METGPGGDGGGCRGAVAGAFRPYEEHLMLAKARANELLAAGKTVDAVISMMSDLKGNPETRGLVDGVLLALGLVALTEAARGNVRLAKDYINGFH